jgi:hypothetical protein
VQAILAFDDEAGSLRLKKIPKIIQYRCILHAETITVRSSNYC